jgi:hypothetical protein
MNKAKLLEQLTALITDDTSTDYDHGINAAIDLVEQLTCITDATFPADIKEPVPLRDYGVLYLVADSSDGMTYITRQDKWLARSFNDKKILDSWHEYVNIYYPETRDPE